MMVIVFSVPMCTLNRRLTLSFAERRQGRKVFVVNALGIDPRPEVAIHPGDMAVRLRWYLSEGGVSKSSINGGSLPLELPVSPSEEVAFLDQIVPRIREPGLP